MKADRGERAGKYAVIWELARALSREIRVRSDPSGQISEEGLRLLGPDWDKLNAKAEYVCHRLAQHRLR